MKKKLLRAVFTFVFLFAIIVSNKAQTWQWAKSCDNVPLGSGGGTSICTDPSGNVFIAGLYFGTLVAGSYSLTSFAGSGSKPYLVKYDANGNVLWAQTSVSTVTNTNDWGMSVCSDAVGNSLLTGFFDSPIITFGTYTLTNTGLSNMFLVKHDPIGNVLWARSPVSTSRDCPYSVSCDASNNVYVTGTFSNTIIFGTTTLTSVSGQKMYLVKYDSSGNVVWAKCNSFGDVFGNTIYGVSVSADSTGNTFVTGGFTSPTLVLGTYTLSNGGIQNIFLAKYDPSGNVIWAKSAVGTSADQANAVSTDGIGNAYITGLYRSSLLTFGTYTLTNAGSQNMFLAKYDNNGNVLWVKNSVDIYNPRGSSVSSNSLAVFITGSMDSLVTLGTYTVSCTNKIDPVFIAKYDVNGNVLYAQAFSSGGDDWLAVSTDKYCNAYISGDFGIKPLVIGTNTLTPTSGTENTFTAKISFTNNCQPIQAGISQYPNLNSQCLIFPNPNNGSFKFRIGNEIDNGELILYNSIGQKMHEQKVIQDENNIITNNLSKGLYHYALSENKRVIYRGKIVID